MEGSMKGMTLMLDLELCTANPHPSGAINIHDLGRTGIMHLTRTSFSTLKKFMTYAQVRYSLFYLKKIKIHLNALGS